MIVNIGCSDTSTSNEEDKLGEFKVSGYGSMIEQEIELKDGRTVTCVLYDSNYSGGISCDWQNTTN